MYKLVAYSFLLSTLIFSSCAADEDDFDEFNILGSWNLTSYSIDGKEVNLSDCDKITSIYYEENYNYEKNTFQSLNGECSISSSETGVWKFLEKNIFTTTPTNGNTYKFSVGFSGNTYTTEDLIENEGVKNLHKYTYTKTN